MKDEASVKSVKKALDALDFILDRSLADRGASLGDISGHLKIRNTTARNILQTMELCGYVGRSEGRLYCPGLKLKWALRNSKLRKLSTVASPILASVAESTGESFVLATIMNGRRHVLLSANGSNPVTADTSRTEQVNPYSAVTTRVMLAGLTSAELDNFTAVNGFPGRNWNFMDSRAKIDSALEMIRRQGFAEDTPNDLRSFAVSITDCDGLTVAALGTYVPSFRADDDCRNRMLRVLKEAASKIESSL